MGRNIDGSTPVSGIAPCSRYLLYESEISSRLNLSVTADAVPPLAAVVVVALTRGPSAKQTERSFQMIRKTLCRAECDLQVVAAGIGVHIQHFACKVEPRAFLLCMVLGSTSRTDTPPDVMTAWARSPGRRWTPAQCFISCTSSRFCSRVIWFALVAGRCPSGPP